MPTRFLRVTRPLCMLLVLLVAVPARAADALDALFRDYDEAWLALNPHMGTSRGDNRHDDQLADEISPGWLAREDAMAQDFLARLDAVDTDALGTARRVSADTFRFNIELLADQHASGIRRKQALMPISQFDGLHIELPQLGSGSGIQPFVTRTDHERWLKRAAGWPAWVDQAIANMREGIAQGVVLPRVLVERVLPQLAAHIVETPEQSVFWGPVARLSDTDRAALEPRYRALITEGIVPGYRRLHDFVRDVYLPAARDSVGRSQLPGGADWYALDIRQHTTLSRSPEEIHATGLQQVALLQKEMDGVRRALGFEGTLPAFYASLRADPRWIYPGEDAALAAFRDMKTRERKELPKYFGRLPKADYEVRPVEAFRAKSAAGGSYQRPDAAGKRPGVFYLNTSDLTRTPTYERVSLSLHETEPGHHFQNALAIENTALPGFQRFGWVPAFGEGWALYAETIGRPMGLYDDPEQYLGFLHNRLFRAIRLVVDTGLHAKGWSREQAIRYFLDNSPTSEGDATAETERYIAWPGQALAYLTGALEIERLRAEAGQRLGARFDLRAFHDEVLGDGIVPLPVLDGKIARWTAERAGG